MTQSNNWKVNIVALKKTGNIWKFATNLVDPRWFSVPMHVALYWVKCDNHMPHVVIPRKRRSEQKNNYCLYFNVPAHWNFFLVQGPSEAKTIRLYIISSEAKITFTSLKNVNVNMMFMSSQFHCKCLYLYFVCSLFGFQLLFHVFFSWVVIVSFSFQLVQNSDNFFFWWTNLGFQNFQF